MVLVDEAHSSNFPFNEELPVSAMELGAHFIDETKLCINVSELNLTGF